MLFCHLLGKKYILYPSFDTYRHKHKLQIETFGPVLLFSQSLSRVWLFATPWTAARQASLPITNSRSLLKLMSIESVMSSNHLILSCPLLLLPPIPPSIRVFSNESTVCMRWTKYWSILLLEGKKSEKLREKSLCYSL